jgi:VIT1/CCC1 family predicted Fe2+/Mn2+ transporter
MQTETLDPITKNRILAVQRTEMTEHHIYRRMAAATRNPTNREVLEHIARDELLHHDHWAKLTGKRARPNRFKVWFYCSVARTVGPTFGLKLMERAEALAQSVYAEIARVVAHAGHIANDEARHEQSLIGMIDEERLKYTGDMVRGLNVAVVETTGLLAGLTLALPVRRELIITGLIAGVVMVLSVASTEYLGVASAGGKRSPVKALCYGVVTNVITIGLLLFPYLIFNNVFVSFGFMALNAVLVIAVFSFYMAVAKGRSFRRQFFEMVLVSLGVAALAFTIGLLARGTPTAH